MLDEIIDRFNVSKNTAVSIALNRGLDLSRIYCLDGQVTTAFLISLSLHWLTRCDIFTFKIPELPTRIIEESDDGVKVKITYLNKLKNLVLWVENKVLS